MIHVDKLKKRYGRNTVIDDLSWALKPGRTVLLGPNGAGKSTLMNCISGVEVPQQGRIRIGDTDITNRNLYYQKLGWMPQRVHALPGMDSLSQVAYCGWLKGMSRSEALGAARAVIGRVGLESKIHAAATSLSGGQLRRLGLAEALIGAPTVLVLDEPSVGLDPGQRQRFRQILNSLENVDCLVSTHQVDDIDTLFDNVAVMFEGKIVYESSVADFLALAPEGLDPVSAVEFSYRQFVPDEA